MIDVKRKELEKFIWQQMEGPGGCGNKYYQVFQDGSSADNAGELLNSTPGIFYSTSILFPAKVVRKGDDNNAESTEETDDLDTVLAEAEDIDDEDRYTFGQRYPKAFAISCCIDTKGRKIEAKDLNITISGRYYKRVAKNNLNNIIVKVDDIEDFKKFVGAYCEGLSGIIKYTSDGISVSKDKIKDIQDNYKAYRDVCKGINRNVCASVAGDNDEQFNRLTENARFLSSYKEKLWHRLQSLDNGTYITDDVRQGIEGKIAQVEKYETYIDYISDLISICDSRSLGFWQAYSFCRPVSLDGLVFNINENERKIFRSEDYPSLSIDLGQYDHIERKLEVLLQATRVANKLYLKIQLVNKTTPYEETKNRYFSMVTEGVNKRAIFGAQIKVQSDLLCAYKDVTTYTTTEDQEKLDYLYKNIESYGVGHLCSIAWDEKEKCVRSEFLPTYDVPDVEPIPRDIREYVEHNGESVPKPYFNDSQVLQFKWLSTFSDTKNVDIVNGLYGFVDSYKCWIDAQKEMLTDGSSDRIGMQNLAQCDEDYLRMRSNIDQILANNQTNMETFRIMNSAMYIQMYHNRNSHVPNTVYNYDFYRTSSCTIDNSPAAWRAFQLAFILLNLDGIIQRPDDMNWDARNKRVDLVWFPTGGGKTEAYLGLIALAIAHRRRTEPNRADGTTVIMRYTLRLLAIQQFQRAMRLVLALDQIRSWNMYNLGGSQISIGLYVGGRALPNKRTSADPNRRTRGQRGEDGLLEECQRWNSIKNGRRGQSKIPIDRCPYCGELLNFRQGGGNRVYFYCQGENCVYNRFTGIQDIPIRLCDEDVYYDPPTLLFGTVDKFALLAHNVNRGVEKNDSRRLFGVGPNLPPSLIIQDELHLLLGPLGSAVGLFEKAIDQLCTYETAEGLRIRPKIISSTATTRNTEMQIRALYDREVSIFPKSGISYDDSFFSFYRRHKVDGEVSYISKRRYMGVMPTGRTQMTTQMRLIATIMVHRALFEQTHMDKFAEYGFRRAMDNYHTVINYFNSLKEVGKVDAQFHTEFTKYAQRLFKRVMRNNNKLQCLYLYDKAFTKSELTGRKSGAEVVDELLKVSSTWNAEHRYPHNDNGVWKSGVTPPDMVLATNMISVGIDVSRFNTMLINSMPRNFAEYIQASSRVARNVEGLVITLHNPYRVRDLSHFERFREFHEKLYYYVEPISITPYSKKVVDKYLALYLIAIIRHRYPELSDDYFVVDPQGQVTATGASMLTEELKNRICEDVKNYFKELLIKVQKEYENECKELLTQSLKSYIDSKIDALMSNWLDKIQNIDLRNTQRMHNERPHRLRYDNSSIANQNNRRQFEFEDLFLSIDDYESDDANTIWSVPMALRNIEPEAVINVKR